MNKRYLGRQKQAFSQLLHECNTLPSTLVDERTNECNTPPCLRVCFSFFASTKKDF